METIPETAPSDISNPVRDAFQELGHKARVAATSAYVALPVLMASASAYGHETGQEHTHPSEQGVALALASLATGALFIRAGVKRTDHPQTGYRRSGYIIGTVGALLCLGSLGYIYSR